jgi:nickel-dependent lactate racemase
LDVTLVNLPYGETTLRLELPEKYTVNVLEPKPAQGVADSYEAIHDAVRNPVAGEPLRDKAKGAKNPLIIISDSTRPTPSDLIVAASLAELKDAGIPEENIKVLIATGLHRPCTIEELQEMLGNHILSEVPVYNHFAEDEKSLEYICDTDLGTPLHVNKLVTESDLLIGDGYIEPHLFAGYTGGGKNILPGVSGAETILCNHGAEMIDHPNARPGKLENNPIYMDIVDGAQLVDYGFSVNVTLNNQKQVSGVFSGDFKEAHIKGTEFLDTNVKIQCNAADISVVTNGGYPLDRDLYQAVKAMVVGEAATREGGTIIVACECRDGIGHPHFRKVVDESSGPDEILEKIRKPGSFTIDQWQAQVMARILQRNRVICVTEGVDADSMKAMHLDYAKNIDEALNAALKQSGADPEINVIPGGPSTIPEVR